MKASYFHKEWGVGVKMYPYSLDFTDSRGDILTVVKKLKKEVFEGKKIHLCECFLYWFNTMHVSLPYWECTQRWRTDDLKKGKQVVKSWAVGEILTDHVGK